MQIQALNVKVGDRIVVYFKNKMQTCTVKYIKIHDQSDITLSVFLGERYRHSSSGIVRFKSAALVNLANQNLRPTL